MQNANLSEAKGRCACGHNQRQEARKDNNPLGEKRSGDLSEQDSAELKSGQVEVKAYCLALIRSDLDDFETVQFPAS
jgi:hypothetical protein